MLGETTQHRRRVFDRDELPAAMHRVADRGDVNVVFVPRGPVAGTRVRAVAAGGQWPLTTAWGAMDDYLPADFEARLARAWGSTRVVISGPVSSSPRRSWSG
jgi:hypothetical protein